MKPGELPLVDAFTDGSSVPNPGPGGWCALLVVHGHIRTLSGSEPETTNNRMELRAAIAVFQALPPPMHVRLHTDSEYLRSGITRWVEDWRRRGWRLRGGNPVSNLDLWKELLEAMTPYEVEWDWIHAHAGHVLNERVDHCARKMAIRGALGVADSHPSAPRSAWCLSVWGSARPSRQEWGYLLQRGAQTVRRNGESANATANQLVLRAAIEGLRRSRPGVRILLRTNSEYLAKGIEKGLAEWPRRGWRTSSGQALRNLALWQELLALVKDRTVHVEHAGPAEPIGRALRNPARAERARPRG